MSKFITFQPIGEILQEAGLITRPQLDLALRDQEYYQDMRLGEILALRGWIEQNTADFFVQEWFKLIDRSIEKPLGFYLRKAGLLTEEQIQRILIEQHKESLRFGMIAVQQGLIKQNTVNFFVKNLFPSQIKKTVTNIQDDQQTVKNIITKDDINYWASLSSKTVTIAIRNQM